MRSFSSWTLALGTGLPLIGGGGTVEYLTNISGGQAYHENLTNISGGQAYHENLTNISGGQAIPNKYLTNTGSCLFLSEFRLSRKFSNTFEIEIPKSGQHCLPVDNSHCTVVKLTPSAIQILVMLTSLESSILVMLTLLESQILVMLTSPESQLLRGFQLPKLI